jgi:hypothetical protein
MATDFSTYTGFYFFSALISTGKKYLQFYLMFIDKWAFRERQNCGYDEGDNESNQ